VLAYFFKTEEDVAVFLRDIPSCSHNSSKAKLHCNSPQAGVAELKLQYSAASLGLAT